MGGLEHQNGGLFFLGDLLGDEIRNPVILGDYFFRRMK